MLTATLTASAAPQAAIKPCGDRERLPKLESYVGIKPQTRFYVDVKWQPPSWFVPVRYIAMPYHQSSRIEWTNLDKWPALEYSHDATLRFRFRYLSAEIQKVPNQHRWWATYSAEIESICVPPKAEQTSLQ